MLRRRGLQIAALAVAVSGAHLWLARDLWPPQAGPGSRREPPQRIAVAFVRDLAPTAPRAVAARPAPALRRLPALKAPPKAAPLSAASAASAPDTLAALPELGSIAALDPAAVASLDAPPPHADRSAASSAVAAASAAAAAASSAATASAVGPEWPPSTRLRYRLTGNYRGPVEGQATVEWLRQGAHYQVFMDLEIGPFFAPLMARHVSSDGEITAQGLRPARYDEETRVLFAQPRRVSVQLGNDEVSFGGGLPVPRPAGVQDSASQFVQLTWLFTVQPALLQPGRLISFPLALHRSVEPWTYRVMAPETLDTPAGAVATMHLMPTREPEPGRTLTAEVWIAPTLQYLPVRILIHQDAQTFIDLAIDRLPQQAAPAEAAATASNPGRALAR